MYKKSRVPLWRRERERQLDGSIGLCRRAPHQQQQTKATVVDTRRILLLFWRVIESTRAGTLPPPLHTVQIVPVIGTHMGTLQLRIVGGTTTVVKHKNGTVFSQ